MPGPSPDAAQSPTRARWRRRLGSNPTYSNEGLYEGETGACCVQPLGPLAECGIFECSVVAILVAHINVDIIALDLTGRIDGPWSAAKMARGPGRARHCRDEKGREGDSHCSAAEESSIEKHSLASVRGTSQPGIRLAGLDPGWTGHCRSAADLDLDLLVREQPPQVFLQFARPEVVSIYTVDDHRHPV